MINNYTHAVNNRLSKRNKIMPIKQFVLNSINKSEIIRSNNHVCFIKGGSAWELIKGELTHPFIGNNDNESFNRNPGFISSNIDMECLITGSSYVCPVSNQIYKFLLRLKKNLEHRLLLV